MDKAREKINAYRAEAEAANERAEAADQQLKLVLAQQTEREQELISLQNRVQLLEEEADKRDAQLAEAKQIQQDNAATLNQSDIVLKNANTQEERIDNLEIQLREAIKNTQELDLLNEGLQRKLTQKEKDVETAETEYETLKETYTALKNEFEEAMRSLDEM
ncbi:tropomyosin [Kickxella alabastrina]|uniref:tropomyosin n=1 Tax=Kickxella alabastrina TaxID=61397 RepID=UPI00221EE995|nr:tropomyosin [Kickxella alabastrina]KAI7825802.1 tropomyosin [Kickxella alabastrina]